MQIICLMFDIAWFCQAVKTSPYLYGVSFRYTRNNFKNQFQNELDIPI